MNSVIGQEVPHGSLFRCFFDGNPVNPDPENGAVLPGAPWALGLAAELLGRRRHEGRDQAGEAIDRLKPSFLGAEECTGPIRHMPLPIEGYG